MKQQLYSLMLIWIMTSPISFSQEIERKISYYDALSGDEKSQSSKPYHLFYDSYLAIGNAKYKMYLSPIWVNPMLLLEDSDTIIFNQQTEIYSQEWYDEYGEPYTITFDSYKDEVNLLDTILTRDSIELQFYIPHLKSHIIQHCEIIVLEDQKYRELDFSNTTWTNISAELSKMYSTFTGNEFKIIINRVELDVDSFLVRFLDKMVFVMINKTNLEH